ncbi:hypothetical protein D9757_006704 [Collybiopsis confluens]|uniref:Uncharacterized protein n=1 Tax=Collybiopsis confluens TaxID=2823264 RepID=A0A8H5HN02_9AGAR|nr:hypothetical protein D9757_006704 [Collybiopsis confluens]
MASISETPVEIQETTTRYIRHVDESQATITEKNRKYADADLATFHEREAGRLILDPAQARVEFGEVFASRLKLTKDGSTILWPQPADDPADPQTWSSRKKDWHLMILSLATLIPNFDSAIGEHCVSVSFSRTVPHNNSAHQRSHFKLEYIPTRSGWAHGVSWVILSSLRHEFDVVTE